MWLCRRIDPPCKVVRILATVSLPVPGKPLIHMSGCGVWAVMVSEGVGMMIYGEKGREMKREQTRSLMTAEGQLLQTRMDDIKLKREMNGFVLRKE